MKKKKKIVIFAHHLFAFHVYGSAFCIAKRNMVKYFSNHNDRVCVGTLAVKTDDEEATCCY